MEYLFITIIPWSTLIQRGSTYRCLFIYYTWNHLSANKMINIKLLIFDSNACNIFLSKQMCSGSSKKIYLQTIRLQIISNIYA